MQFTKLEIPDVVLIEPRRLDDIRGYFMEVFHEKVFRTHVADVHFVQDNEAMSAGVGTVRGLHFQKPPAAHGKLVRVLNGAVYDVAVDIRHGSPFFGKHVGLVLDASSAKMLWIPPGFAHGYCTLKNDNIVAYKITDFYSAEHDAGIVWNDPDLGINWPVTSNDAILSDKDRLLPAFMNIPPLFTFQENLIEKQENSCKTQVNS
ncbi:unnamed protein product [Rotaria sp. Silwood1]|nr:unnamed protein product [Rotaria sp. Silwood1]